MEKPCEKYRASPGFRYFLIVGQIALWAASVTSIWMIVPRLRGLFDVEQRLAGDPAVLDGAVPVLPERLGLADDDVEAVVPHVQGLGRALHAVADDRDGLLLEHLAGLGQRKLFAGDDVLLDAAKIDHCHDSLLFVVAPAFAPGGEGLGIMRSKAIRQRKKRKGFEMLDLGFRVRDVGAGVRIRVTGTHSGAG